MSKKNLKGKKSGMSFSIGGNGKLAPEPSDEEIEEILALGKDKKFEPGIYNYCDRWCEKCADTAKCFLYTQEEWRKEKRGGPAAKSARPFSGEKANHENEDDFFAEITYGFKTVKKLITAIMEKEGLNPNDFKNNADDSWDRNIERKYDNKECLKLSKEYMKQANGFLKKYYAKQEQYRSEFNLEIKQDDINDKIEAVGWYHAMLPAKVWRSLYDREDYQREKDNELKAMLRENMEKCLRLTEKCFQKSREALVGLARKREDWGEDLAALLNRLNLAEISFREEFDLKQVYNIIPPQFNSEQMEIMETFSRNQEKGLEAALAYIAREPEDKLIYGIIGDMYINLGRFNDAISHLETGARLNPNDAIVRFLWGAALSKIGRFNQGLKILLEALELEPDNLEIQRNIGWVTSMRGRFQDNRAEIEKGRNILKEVVERQPDNALAMTDLGQSYLMAHDFSHALEWMEKAISVEPDSDFVRMIYRDVKEMSRQYEENKNFQEFVEKQKAIKAYSGPPAETDEEMDDNVARQFEIEGLINELNSGRLTREEAAKIMEKLEETGVVGQVTAVGGDNPVDAKTATEYIEYHQKIPQVEKKIGKEKTTEYGRKLLSGKISLTERKKMILILAHQGTREALEILEKLDGKAEGEMKVWLKMAMDECRAFMESGKDGPKMFFNKL